MTTVTREHLAGLKIAHDVLSAMTSRQVSDEACMEIERLAMKASAAPEQEPVAWITRASLEKLKQGLGLPCEISAKLQFDFGFTEALYTHADPSDVAQLRAENARLTNQRDAILLQARVWAGEAKTQQAITSEVGEILGGIPSWGPIAAGVEAATQRADAAERKLGEALAIIERVKVKELVSPNCPLGKRIDALLSASAEPAKQAYPIIRRVRAHSHRCANVQPGSTVDDVCDCGAVVDGKAVELPANGGDVEVSDAS